MNARTPTWSPHQRYERARGPRSAKLVDGVLDLLPDGPEWSEDEMQQWLAVFAGALRWYYGLPLTPNPQNEQTRRSPDP